MENTGTRTERSERNRRNRAKSAEPEAALFSQKPSGRGNDAFARLAIVQCITVAAALAAVFVLGRIGAPEYNEIKKLYNEAMSRDMSASEIVSAFKSTAKEVLAYGAGNDEEVVQAFAPDAAEKAQAVTDNQTESTTLERLGSEAGETVAVGEMDEAGGRDIGTEEAAKGTSFAMYEISEKPAMPVNSSRITSGFGYRTNPISGNYGFHTGIDLSSPLGSPISSVFFGVVEETGEDDQWGKYVLIKHSDSLQTYYCHCSEVFAREGDVIRKGETVALVGSTGWSTGPHLHFEVRIGGIRVDPSVLLFGKRS